MDPAVREEIVNQLMGTLTQTQWSWLSSLMGQPYPFTLNDKQKMLVKLNLSVPLAEEHIKMFGAIV